MLQFVNPEYLLLILLVPAIIVAYALSMRYRRRVMERFAEGEFLKKLTPSVSKGRGWAKIILFCIAWIFFSVGIARPQIGVRLKEHESKGVELMIALDVSNSMLAEDYKPNRLERAKLSIARLVDKMHNDRIGLIIFAGQSFVQLPITTDYVSAKMFLNAVSTENIPIQGTSLTDAINTAVKSFSLESENSRAVILITDGEDHEEDAVAAARTAYEAGVRIYTIGVGSPEGKPIPMPNGELLKDKDGKIVITRLNEQMLQDIADVGGGVYVKAGSSDFGLNTMIDSIRELEQKKYKSIVFSEYDEQYMYFFALALLFLIMEMLVGNVKTGRKLFK